jgi:hypothetical protein
MADYINKKKCAVVGGLTSWQDHLKTYLPSCRFVTPDELNMDMNFLLNVDLVFFNEAINNHSMYQKVKSTLFNSDIPICYTGTNTNIKISLKKMYDKLRSIKREPIVTKSID